MTVMRRPGPGQTGSLQNAANMCAMLTRHMTPVSARISPVRIGENIILTCNHAYQGDFYLTTQEDFWYHLHEWHMKDLIASPSVIVDAIWAKNFYAAAEYA